MKQDQGLATRDVGTRMLAEAETPQDYVDVLRFAEAARVAAKQARLGPAAVDQASRLAAKALLGLAVAVEEGQLAGAIKRHGGDRSKSQGMTLAQLDIHNQHLRDGRLMRDAGWTDEEIDLLEAAGEGTFDGRAQIVALARSIVSGIAPGEGDDWYTPRWLFDQLGVIFDVDVCAPVDPASRSCPARTYWTEEDDGLAQDWRGLVWCNPPYSYPAPWAERWLDHGNGLLLTHIPANAGWAVDVWRRAEAAIWLQAMHFERPNGETHRPGYALQLAAIGPAAVLLDNVDAPKSGSVWRRQQ